jgi:hypothetical protein
VILETQPNYPTGRSYVLKLHRDAGPNRIVGRLENLATGKQVAFTTAEELLAILMRDAEKTARSPFPVKCEF